MQLTTDHPPNLDSKVEQAKEFAKQKHACQLRKDGKTLYWVHLEQVGNNAMALRIKDNNVLCAAWLHDTIEDTNTDFDNIAEKFNSEVAQIMAAITKDKRLPEEGREQNYLDQLRAASWKAQVVKLCDIWANVADLPSGYRDRDKQAEQVDKKLKYFEAVRKGLSANRNRIPNLDKGVDDLNALLSFYGKPPLRV
jgi:(p)ppGpp synthase/HD superfamily hydrolase